MHGIAQPSFSSIRAILINLWDLDLCLRRVSALLCPSRRSVKTSSPSITQASLYSLSNFGKTISCTSLKRPNSPNMPKAPALSTEVKVASFRQSALTTFGEALDLHTNSFFGKNRFLVNFSTTVVRFGLRQSHGIPPSTTPLFLSP